MNKTETKQPLYRVLIVDDEAPVRELLATLLRAPNRSIEVRDSARAALEFVQHDPIDVAFVDGKLPGVAGTAFAEKIRTRCPRAHVVIHTGCIDTTMLHEAGLKNEQRNLNNASDVGEVLELADSYTSE
jgi:CheY-like chemotaxis protein